MQYKYCSSLVHVTETLQSVLFNIPPSSIKQKVNRESFAFFTVSLGFF